MKRLPILRPMGWLAVGLLVLVIPATAPAGGDPDEGKKTYDLLCGICHGATGAGDGPAGSAIDPPPRNFNRGEFKFDADKDGVTGTDEDLFIVIKKGGASFGGNPVMVPWSSLSDAEVSNVIAYIRTLEARIDEIVDLRGMPETFVVPGGSSLAAALDVARTVVRRAERRAVEYAEAGGLDGSSVVPFLNRMADYVYMLARDAEPEWEPSRTED